MTVYARFPVYWCVLQCIDCMLMWPAACSVIKIGQQGCTPLRTLMSRIGLFSIFLLDVLICYNITVLMKRFEPQFEADEL